MRPQSDVRERSLALIRRFLVPYSIWVAARGSREKHCKGLVLKRSTATIFLRACWRSPGKKTAIGNFFASTLRSQIQFKIEGTAMLFWRAFCIIPMRPLKH